MPKTPITTSARNISVLQDTTYTENHDRTAASITYKEEAQSASVDFLVLLLESLKQLKFGSSNKVSIENNTSIIKNNIYNLVNNYKSVVNFNGNKEIIAILRQAESVFSPSSSSISEKVKGDVEQITMSTIEQLEKIINSKTSVINNTGDITNTADIEKKKTLTASDF